jgi:GT2 family glycosyltransferase
MINDLAIIIINRDNKSDTVECIDSLLKAGSRVQQIIVVDNGSKDDSVDYLKQKYGGETPILQAKENFGYPYGLNLGIKYSMAQGTQWFLLMNNDTIVAEDFLEKLSDAVRNGPQYSLFGPMILYHSEPHKIWFMGCKRIPGTMLFINQHRGKLDLAAYDPLIPIDFVHGCTMLVKRDVFESIGYFDDSSPIYGDDVDFSWRARLAGFKMAAVSPAKMWHKVSTFMKQQKPMARYLRIRNQIKIYRRYAVGLQYAFLFLFTFFRSIVIGIKDLFSGQTQLISPLIYGFIDGWKGSGDRKF